ncbi:MAG: DUF6477 family protein [Paracoccaceae bacterium]|nr:DUF6477 family protein [Paracoccaceae bacterium]
MASLQTALADLRRPRLLISAARFGLADYDRSRDLRRLLRLGAVPSPGQAVARLMDEEAGLEATRQAGAATYSVSRHVDLLIALMGEARLLARAGGDAA